MTVLLLILINVNVSNFLSSCWNGDCYRPQPPKSSTASVKKIKTTSPSHSPTNPPTPQPQLQPHEIACNDIISFMFVMPDALTAKMKNMCENRFAQLYRSHYEHQALIRKQPVWIHHIREPVDNVENSHLIVLDLDETIMDQTSYYMDDHAFQSNDIDFKSQNYEDLIVNFNKLKHAQTGSRTKIRVGIFRQHLMHFINFTQTGSR
eukprot:171929_1